MPRPADADFLHWADEINGVVDDEGRVVFELAFLASRHCDDSGGVPEVDVMMTFPAASPLADPDDIPTAGSASTGELLRYAAEARRRAMDRFGWYDRSVAMSRLVGEHRPAGRRYPDDWWDRVALAFFGFLTSEVHGPVQRFAEASGVPSPTANRWLATCRERGLLTDEDELAGSALDLLSKSDVDEGNGR